MRSLMYTCRCLFSNRSVWFPRTVVSNLKRKRVPSNLVEMDKFSFRDWIRTNFPFSKKEGNERLFFNFCVLTRLFVAYEFESG